MPPFNAATWHKLAHEFHAGRAATAPDHLAFVAGAGIAREREAQGGRQRHRIVDADLRAGTGNVLHHALARGKAAIQRDPRRLAHRFTRFPFPKCSHVPAFDMPTPRAADLSKRLI